MLIVSLSDLSPSASVGLLTKGFFAINNINIKSDFKIFFVPIDISTAISRNEQKKSMTTH